MEKGDYWITYKVIGEGFAEITLKEGEDVKKALDLYFLLNGIEITNKETSISKIEKI